MNSIQEISDCVYDDLIQFCGEFCKNCNDFSELKDRISDVTIKSKRTTKISKFTLKLYAFVYQRIMKFPLNKLEFETVATNNLFEKVHQMVMSKFIYIIHTSQFKLSDMLMTFAIEKLGKIKTLFRV